MEAEWFRIVDAEPNGQHANLIIQMIKELLVFEKYPDNAMTNNTEKLREDLAKGHVHGLLALENNSNNAIGYILYYYAYSTWEGRFVFMEDLFVRAEHRRKGVGTALWKKLAQITVAQNLPRLQWNVLNWNKNALALYDKVGGINLTETEGWFDYRLNGDNLKNLANN